MLEQLSAQDASFIFMESPATPMHVGSLAIYDPSSSDADVLSEERYTRFQQERLHLWPASRRRLAPVPFNADYPYWIEDEDFELDYHMRRIGLPKPGDWAELHKMAARIFERPLDMSKPLWEFYIIEGLDNLEGVPKGSFAVLSKTHHAAIDGASGMHLVELLHDLTPQVQPVPPPQTPWRADIVPSDADLLFRAWANNFATPFKFLRVWTDTTRSLPRMTEALTSNVQQPYSVPRTRFNGRVSGHRVIGARRFDLEAVRKLRKVVDGATVNDAVLAICAGGIRAYLQSKSELPGDSVVAMAPINVRTESERDVSGNRVSAMFLPIGTDIKDPIERLRVIRERTAANKSVTEAGGARLATDYAQFVPAYTAALAGRMAAQVPDPQSAFNVSITNVPGPTVPLYSMGARMVTSVGIGPITQGMGLIMPVSSYCGELVIAFTSCTRMIPDPDHFSACLEDAFTALRDAALGGTIEPSAEVAEPSTAPEAPETVQEAAPETATKPAGTPAQTTRTARKLRENAKPRKNAKAGKNGASRNTPVRSRKPAPTAASTGDPQ